MSQYYAIHADPGTPAFIARFNLETDRDAWCARFPQTRRHADAPDDLSGFRPAQWGMFPEPVIHGWTKELPVSPDSPKIEAYFRGEDWGDEGPEGLGLPDVEIPPALPPDQAARLSEALEVPPMPPPLVQKPRFGLVLPETPPPAEVCQRFAETLQPVGRIPIGQGAPGDLLTLVRLLAFTGCPVEALKHEARAVLAKHGLVTPEEAALKP